MDDTDSFTGPVMDIAFHIGAHSTDHDLLLNCLRHNAGMLAREGTIVPAPQAYREAMREAVHKLQESPADVDEEDSLLELVLKGMHGRRLVMSSENFICVPQRVFDEGGFYNKIAYKPSWFRNAFPSHRVSFYLAVRNPASFIPSLYLRRPQTTFEEYLAAISLDQVRWSRVIADLADAVPDCEVTVWCMEDAPLIWPEVMAAVAGRGSADGLERTDVHLRSIMNGEGLSRLHAYLEARPDIGVPQRRWATIAFLDKYADPDALEESFDLDAWTQDTIENLTETYEADMAQVADIPGVTLIQP